MRCTRHRGDPPRVALTTLQEQLVEWSPGDFSDLRALFINCMIMERNGVRVDVIRAVDHDSAPGVCRDMPSNGCERDERPAIFEQVLGAASRCCLRRCGLGEEASVCTQVI